MIDRKSELKHFLGEYKVFRELELVLYGNDRGKALTALRELERLARNGSGEKSDDKHLEKELDEFRAQGPAKERIRADYLKLYNENRN
jgi:hypothetical protein